MIPGRYRCHAAIIDGEIISPALVTITTDQRMSATRFDHETLATTDLNGVIIALPTDCATPLPSHLSPRGLLATLSEIEIKPSSAPVIPYFIPLTIPTTD